jgi:hypothetical protein
MISDFGFRISDWSAKLKFKILRFLTYFRPLFSPKGVAIAKGK